MEVDEIRRDVRLTVRKADGQDNIYEMLIKKIIKTIFQKGSSKTEVDTYDLLSAETINIALGARTLYPKIGSLIEVGGNELVGEIISLVRVGLSLGFAIRDNNLSVTLEEVEGEELS